MHTSLVANSTQHISKIYIFRCTFPQVTRYSFLWSVQSNLPVKTNYESKAGGCSVWIFWCLSTGSCFHKYRNLEGIKMENGKFKPMHLYLNDVMLYFIKKLSVIQVRLASQLHDLLVDHLHVQSPALSHCTYRCPSNISALSMSKT